jgi:hypothetical protein
MNSRRCISAGCLAFLLLTGIGCSDKNSVPSGILSREKMENVLWDMIQADQYSTLYLAKDSAHINTKMENLRLYEQVFLLHQVTREEFRKSYQYYLDHPALNQVLFDSLISRGNRLRTESYSRPVLSHPSPSVAGGLPPRSAGGLPQAMPATPPIPGRIPAVPVKTPVTPGKSPALPVQRPPSPGRIFPSLHARDSAARARLHPAKKDTIRQHS